MAYDIFSWLITRARHSLLWNIHRYSRSESSPLIFMLEILCIWLNIPFFRHFLDRAKLIVLGKDPPLLSSVDRTMRAHTSLFTLPTWVCLFVNVELHIQEGRFQSNDFHRSEEKLLSYDRHNCQIKQYYGKFNIQIRMIRYLSNIMLLIQTPETSEPRFSSCSRCTT